MQRGLACLGGKWGPSPHLGCREASSWRLPGQLGSRCLARCPASGVPTEHPLTPRGSSVSRSLPGLLAAGARLAGWQRRAVHLPGVSQLQSRKEERACSASLHTKPKKTIRPKAPSMASAQPWSPGWAGLTAPSEAEACQEAPVAGPGRPAPGPERDPAATTGSPGAHSGMTTRELQEYWRGERGDRKPVRLIFDIASARIEEGTPCRFVMYQVVVIQTGSYDSTKAVLERRYSDFEALQRGLLRAFPEEMEDVAFPGKRLLGNLAPALIAARSRALAEYLRQLAGLRCVRRSRELLDFLTRPELREAFGCLRAGQYARALGALGRAGPLQARLTAHKPAAAAPPLCAALLCLRELERPLEAFAAGERALARLRDGHRYLEPLLDAMVHLARALGRDCAPLQRRLEDCQLRRPSPRGLTLKELAVREYLD